MQEGLIDRVAWVGLDNVDGPIRALVLRFSGLGATGMKAGADPMELEWGAGGALVVTPYHDPWAWMNGATQIFTNELVDALFLRHRLPTETPIVATGGSMGGQGALIYSLRARRPVAACAAISPVCDVPYHYTERDDLPRTMHHAFGSYGEIGEALIEHSPLHQAAQMPDIPYLLVHGDRDMAVGKTRHSDALAAALRARHLRVEYQERATMGHCGPLDWALHQRIAAFVREQWS